MRLPSISPITLLIFLIFAQFGMAEAFTPDKEVKKPWEADKKSNWEKDAESAFGLSKGLGKRLMSEGEWREHRHRMQLMSENEKKRYQGTVKQDILKKGRDSGIPLEGKTIRKEEPNKTENKKPPEKTNLRKRYNKHK